MGPLHGPAAATVRLVPAPGPPAWRLQSDAVNERLLSRWLRPGLGVLLKTDLYDEAVSPGLYPALRDFARVVGIDLSPEVVAAATRRHPGLDGSVADVRLLPFESGSFDAVFSNSTLDHLGDRYQVELAVAELARVMRPGARLVITLDNPLNPLVAIRNHLPRRMERWARRGFGYRPGWTCGPRRLRALLGAHGLEVRAQTAILHAPRALVALANPRTAAARARLARTLLAAERLEAGPTRYVTGHFVAALAVRAGEPGDAGRALV